MATWSCADKRPTTPPATSAARGAAWPMHTVATPKQNPARPRDSSRFSPLARPAGWPAATTPYAPGRRPCSSAEGGAGACSILANRTTRFCGPRPAARRLHSSRAIVATSPDLTSATATIRCPSRWRCRIGAASLGNGDGRVDRRRVCAALVSRRRRRRSDRLSLPGRAESGSVGESAASATTRSPGSRSAWQVSSARTAGCPDRG
jgi:hypothetical protein